MGTRGQGTPPLADAAALAVQRPGADGRRDGRGTGAARRAVRSGVPPRRRAGTGSPPAGGGALVPGPSIGAGGSRRGAVASGREAAPAGRQGRKRADEFGPWPGRAGAGEAGRGATRVPVSRVPDGQPPRRAGTRAGPLGGLCERSRRGGGRPRRNRRAFGAAPAAVACRGWGDWGVAGGGLSPLGHSVSRLPWLTAVHDCEAPQGAAILRSGLAAPEPVLPLAVVE